MFGFNHRCNSGTRDGEQINTTIILCVDPKTVDLFHSSLRLELSWIKSQWDDLTSEECHWKLWLQYHSVLLSTLCGVNIIYKYAQFSNGFIFLYDKVIQIFHKP